MFKKIGKGLLKSESKNKVSIRYQFDVQIVDLDGLPDSVKKCKIVWCRSSKSKETDTKPVRQGIASFKQTLTQISSISVKSDSYESKEFTFKVQVPKDGSSSMVTVGKSNVDMSEYVDDASCVQKASIPITIKVGSGSKGLLKIVVTSTPLGAGGSEDGKSMMSGASVYTDQDLNGFHDDARSGASGSSKKSSKPTRPGSSSHDDDDDKESRSSAGKARGRRPALPTTTEEPDDDDDEDDGGAMFKKTASGRAAPPPVADPFAKKTAAKKKPAARKAYSDSDEDISPMSSDVEDGPAATRPSSVAARIAGSAATDSKPKKGLMGLMQKKEATPSRPPIHPQMAEPLEKDAKAEQAAFSSNRAALFGGPAAAKSAASKAGSRKGEVTEDDARSALFSASKPATAAKPAASSRLPRPPPVEDKEGSRSALLSAGTSKASTASSKPKRPPPLDPEEDEEGARSALFTAAPASAATSRASKAAPAPRGDSEEDEETSRSALFGGGAPAKSKKASELKRPPPAPPPARSDSGDDSQSSEEASPPPICSQAQPATAAAPAKFSQSAKPTPPRPAFSDTDEESEDELGVGPSRATAAVGGAAAGAASRGFASSSKGGGPPKSTQQASQGLSDDDPFGDDPSDNPFGDDNAFSKPAKRNGVATAAAAGAGAAAGAAASRGVSSAKESADNKALRDQVAQLQAQLEVSAKRESMLTKDVETYRSQVLELEDKLDEADVDPAELFGQLTAMEQKHEKEKEQLEKKHTAVILAVQNELSASGAGFNDEELEELRDAHDELRREHAATLAELAELQTLLESEGRKLASHDELRREHAATLAELEELHAQLESKGGKLAAHDELHIEHEETLAELAELRMQLKSEGVKLVATNKMVDDSMIMATLANREKRQLTDEVERLKSKLEDASIAETAAMAREIQDQDVGKDSVVAELQEEVESLQEEIQDLQAKVKDLKKENGALEKKLVVATVASAAVGAAASSAATKSRASRYRSRLSSETGDDAGSTVYAATPAGGDAGDKAALAVVTASAAAAAAATALAVASQEKEKLREKLAASEVMVSNLMNQVAQLETFCEEVESQGATDISALKMRIAELEQQVASSAATLAAASQLQNSLKGGAPQVNEGVGGDVLELQDELADAQIKLKRMDRERASLLRQLEQEEVAREGLEDQLKGRVEDYGDDEALDAVEAFESKYARMKERYKDLERRSQDDLDQLADQLVQAQHTVKQLQKQVHELQENPPAAPNASYGARAGRAASRVSLDAIEENQLLIQKLVDTQMEMALMMEQEAMLRRDKLRAIEAYRQLKAQLEGQPLEDPGRSTKSPKGPMFRRSTNDLQ